MDGILCWHRGIRRPKRHRDWYLGWHHNRRLYLGWNHERALSWRDCALYLGWYNGLAYLGGIVSSTRLFKGMGLTTPRFRLHDSRHSPIALFLKKKSYYSVYLVLIYVPRGSHAQWQGKVIANCQCIICMPLHTTHETQLAWVKIKWSTHSSQKSKHWTRAYHDKHTGPLTPLRVTVCRGWGW
jgi:hypothetical protein